MIGREAEVAQVEALVADARAGRSGALVVTGEAGIGKTALLAVARARAEGLLVLAAAGSEAEGALAFAALGDLLRPVVGHLDEIPPAQAEALRGALALGPPVPGDRFTAYVATLSLLAAAAEHGPVLCLIDDAHWLDVESFEAVQFAARRLEAEGIALVLGVREGVTPRADAVPLPRLRLTGLARADAELLVSANAPVAPAPHVLREIVEGAAGNPLAIIELAGSLSPGQLTGRQPLPDPLPVGRYLERALLRGLDDLPLPTRRALLLAAADDGASDLLPAALASEGMSIADLEPAERMGIVSVGPARLAFSHPLVRAAIYQAAEGPDRRSAHQAHADAARAQGDASALDRRAWHLALASAGPDDAAAAELEAAAGRAAARNAHGAATEALEAAGRLSTVPPEQGRRLLAAAQSALAAGAFPRASVLFDQVAALGADPGQVVEAMAGRGHAETFGGSARRAIDLLVAAADRLEPVAPDAAATLLAQASLPCQMRADVGRGLALATRAVRLVGSDAPAATRAVVDTAFTAATLYCGEPAALDPATEPALADAIASGDPSSYLWAVTIQHLLGLREEYAEALLRVDAFVAVARARSMPSALPYPLTFRAEMRMRTGRLQEARADAGEAAHVAEATAQDGLRGYAYGTLARVEALLGLTEECRRHAAQGLLGLETSEADSLSIYAGAALGHLALALGDLPTADEHFTAVERRYGDDAEAHFLLVPFAHEQAEVRIRLGGADEARAAIEVLAKRAGVSRSAWGRAALARCRGLAASDAEFEEHFATALAEHATTPTPIEQARTLLCLGERRRRARRPREARRPLEEALAIFEDCGASAWAEWARRELRATGVRPRDARPAVASELTAQELQVALVVAGGATNKEAAAALLISPKTVEYHLGRAYAKLGVRSRSQLAARIVATSPPEGRVVVTD